MKILLIHPRLERSFFSDIKLPPLGLASIAGVLREAGHDVRIFDGILSGNQIRDIKDRLADDFPEIVGIGATSALAEISLQIAALIKSREPKTAVVMGGVHPTLFPRQMISNPQIDYVVRGEGELSMAELAKALESEREPAGIAGVVYKTKGEIVVNGPRKPVDNLDDLPMPAYDLLPIRRYTSLQIAERPFASMITSRGCPYSCVFCSARLTMGPKYRASLRRERSKRFSGSSGPSASRRSCSRTASSRWISPGLKASAISWGEKGSRSNGPATGGSAV